MQETAPEAPNSNTDTSAAEGMNTSPLINEDYQYALQAIELGKQSSSTNGADAIIRDVWISNFF